MSVFKVVSRDINSGKQVKKKVYESNTKFNLYSKDLICRWSEWWDIEVYEMKDEEYRLLYEIKAPRTTEDLEKMAIERNYSDTWLKYRKKDLVDATKKEQ